MVRGAALLGCLACAPERLPAQLTGDLVLTTARDVSRASLVQEVGGDLFVAGTSLEEVSLPSLETVGGSVRIWENVSLGTWSSPLLDSVGGELSVYDNRVLSDLSGLGALQQVGGVLRVNRMPGLTALALEVTDLGGLYLFDDAALRDVSLPALTTLGGDVSLWELPALEAVRLPVVEEIRGALDLFDDDALTVLEFPRLTRLQSYELHHCDAMAHPGSFPSLRVLPRRLTLQYNASMVDLDGLGALAEVNEARIRFNPALEGLGAWPIERVSQRLTVSQNRSLASVTLASLALAPEVEIVGNQILDRVAFPLLEEVEEMRLLDNPRWPGCDIEAMLERLQPDEALCSGNGPDGCGDWCAP